MSYIDPGAGGVILQAIGGLLIGWVATLGKVRRFFPGLLSKKDPPT